MRGKLTAPPRELVIGIDSSGLVTKPPIRVVATRFSRRGKQVKYVIFLSKEKIKELALKYRDWNEKISAVLFFKAINGKNMFPQVPRYVIHIDREFHGKTRLKVYKYLKKLFGTIYSGKPDYTNPQITFRSKKGSQFVRHAHRKSQLAKRRKIPFDEKNPNITWMLNILK